MTGTGPASRGASCGCKQQRTRRWRTGVVALTLSLVGCMLSAGSAFAVVEKPVNVGPPTISGKTQEGSQLKAKKGEWKGGSLTYTYQWQRCEPECANIANATEANYTLRYVDIGSRIRVIVTASNSAGSAEEASAESEEIQAVAPKSSVAPEVKGTPEEGQLLEVTDGKWSGTPANSYAFQWELCNAAKRCTEISGADESSYRATKEDVNSFLRATVRAIVSIVNPPLEGKATSALTEVVKYGPPSALDFPQVAGQLRVGGTLEASPGHWVGETPIGYSYTWEACGSEGSCHSVGSGVDHAIEAAEVGDSIRVTATATNGRGTAASTSVPTPFVLGGSQDFAVAWGEDYRGQLGTDYRTLWEDRPVLVEGVTNITTAVAGGGSMELHANGTLTASGEGYYGTLGYGGRKASWEQGKGNVPVKGLTEVTQVSSGGEGAAALLANGTVWDWGNNGYGILGNGKGGFEVETGENQLEPKEVSSLRGLGVTSVEAGSGSRWVTLPGSGKLLAWGYNRWGQLGIAWPTSCLKKSTCEPEIIKGKDPYKFGEWPEAEHTCHAETGWELCFKTPSPVVYASGAEVEGVTQVAAGAESAYALLNDGEVLSWGNDGRGQLGQTLTPGPHTNFTYAGKVMVSETETLKHVVALSAGRQTGLALVEAGGHKQLWGWGNDGGGALGVAAETCGKVNKHGEGKTWPCDRYARQLAGPEGVSIAQIAGGGNFSVVLGSEGEVYTVGDNSLGQLGRGPGCEQGTGEMGLYESCYSTVWQSVPGLSGVQSVSASNHGVMAIVAAGSPEPLPVVDSQPSSGSLGLQWNLPAGETSESVVYRVWDHPGEDEAGEGEGGEGGQGSEGEGTGEEGEEPIEEGIGEPPTNTLAPHIHPYELVEGEWVKAKLKEAVGDLLVASPGNWSGTQPISSYEYQWLLCKGGGQCAAIAGATSSEYTIPEEDAGKTIEVSVTARNGVKPAGVATSEPTEVIKAEGEGRKSPATRIKLEGLDGVLIGELAEPQYEVKLNSTEASGRGKARVMVLAG